MDRFIPYGRQHITTDDEQAVLDTLRSDYLTQGPQIPQFESALCNYVGAQYAIAVNSATSALHISCLALGVGENDTVWTSPNSFVASANCALYCGANIDFVDIDPNTLNMSATQLKLKLQETREQGGKMPKVVIPVHFSGEPCEMDKIKTLAMEFDFKIIEDASHAIGASFNQSRVGNCRYSDITVFSFHPVKIITSAEGGIATTNDPQLAKRLDLLRSHGITKNQKDFENSSPNPWEYEQHELGFNYRLTDLQAALGESQLSRIDQYIKRRTELAGRYDDELQHLPVTSQSKGIKNQSSNHLYVLSLQGDKKTMRPEFFGVLRKNNIGVNIHYIPIHTQPYFKKLGFKAGDFPIAEDYYSRCISIPLFGSMTDEEQTKVIKTIKTFF